jgi:hypothetical protein
MNIKDADIVCMTGEAGGFDATPVFLKRFAELVAAHEREECAMLCDRFQERGMQPAECAGAIRARGKA